MSIDPVSTTTLHPRTFRSNPLIRGVLRTLLPAAAVILALAAQVSVAPRLHLPHAGPDLVLLVVLGFAAAWGPTGGAVTGFAAGLAVDLAPPSVDAAGRHALLLTCVGALAGRTGSEVRTSALRTCILAGIYAGAAVLGNALLGTVLGDGGGITRAGLLTAAGAAGLYTAVATPIVVPGIARLARTSQNPGAQVLAPVGDPYAGPASAGGDYAAGGYGPYEGVTFRGAVATAGVRPLGSAARQTAHPVRPQPAHTAPAAHQPSAHTHPGHAHPDHTRPEHAHPAHEHAAHDDPPRTEAGQDHPAPEQHDPAAPDLPARGTVRAFQHPEAG